MIPGFMLTLQETRSINDSMNIQKIEFISEIILLFLFFQKQMQKIMIHCFNSVKHKLQSRLGFFDLFGLDFMVDTDMRVSVCII